MVVALPMAGQGVAEVEFESPPSGHVKAEVAVVRLMYDWRAQHMVTGGRIQTPVTYPLHKNGIQITVSNQFRSCLMDSKQKRKNKIIKWNSEIFLKVENSEYGVPQESILRLFLFIIYINDLPPTINILYLLMTLV
jgi:hypothetical protein